MIKTIALAAALFATAACAQSSAPPSGAPVAPTSPTQIPETPAPPPSLVPPPAPGAQCEAASLAWLVGKPRTEIPVPVDPSHRRVYCSTCLVTQDYWPDRTDIVYDSKTGIVLSVKCG